MVADGIGGAERAGFGRRQERAVLPPRRNDDLLAEQRIRPQFERIGGASGLGEIKDSGQRLVEGVVPEVAAVGALDALLSHAAV